MIKIPQMGTSGPDAEFKYLEYYLIRNEKRSTFFNAIPAPLATLCNGSSAIWNGMLILS